MKWHFLFICDRKKISPCSFQKCWSHSYSMVSVDMLIHMLPIDIFSGWPGRLTQKWLKMSSEHLLLLAVIAWSKSKFRTSVPKKRQSKFLLSDCHAQHCRAERYRKVNLLFAVLIIEWNKQFLKCLKKINRTKLSNRKHFFELYSIFHVDKYGYLLWRCHRTAIEITHLKGCEYGGVL